MEEDWIQEFLNTYDTILYKSKPSPEARKIHRYPPHQCSTLFLNFRTIFNSIVDSDIRSITLLGTHCEPIFGSKRFKERIYDIQDVSLNKSSVPISAPSCFDITELFLVFLMKKKSIIYKTNVSLCNLLSNVKRFKRDTDRFDLNYLFFYEIGLFKNGDFLLEKNKKLLPCYRLTEITDNRIAVGFQITNCKQKTEFHYGYNFREQLSHKNMVKSPLQNPRAVHDKNNIDSQDSEDILIDKVNSQDSEYGPIDKINFHDPKAILIDEVDSQDSEGILIDEVDSQDSEGILIDEVDSQDSEGILIDEVDSQDSEDVLIDEVDSQDPKSVLFDSTNSHDPKGVLTSNVNSHDPKGVLTSNVNSHDPKGVLFDSTDSQDLKDALTQNINSRDPKSVLIGKNLIYFMYNKNLYVFSDFRCIFCFRIFHNAHTFKKHFTSIHDKFNIKKIYISRESFQNNTISRINKNIHKKKDPINNKNHKIKLLKITKENELNETSLILPKKPYIYFKQNFKRNKKIIKNNYKVTTYRSQLMDDSKDKIKAPDYVKILQEYKLKELADINDSERDFMQKWNSFIYDYKKPFNNRSMPILVYRFLVQSNVDPVMGFKFLIILFNKCTLSHHDVFNILRNLNNEKQQEK